MACLVFALLRSPDGVLQGPPVRFLFFKKEPLCQKHQLQKVRKQEYDYSFITDIIIIPAQNTHRPIFPKVISEIPCFCCFVYLKQGFHVVPWWDGGDHRLMMRSQKPDDWSAFRSLSFGPRWFLVSGSQAPSLRSTGSRVYPESPGKWH